MAKKVTKRSVIKQMQELGVYRSEFDNIIDIYVSMVNSHGELFEKWISQGYPYETQSESGGAKKAPIVQTLDSMQRNIIAYADRLGLSPKAMNNMKTTAEENSKFEQTLTLLEGGAGGTKNAAVAPKSRSG